MRAAPTAVAEQPHQHGVAELLVAVDGTEVAIELMSPAANFFGYEHKPRTAAQWHQADRSLARLLEPATIDVQDGAGASCPQVSTEWETSLFNAATLAKANFGQDEHDHHEPAGAGHDEHDQHQHADAEHDHHGHADMLVTYTFTCSGDPRTVQHRLFTAFPDLSEISVSVATAQGQSAQHQHRGDDTSISLER